MTIAEDHRQGRRGNPVPVLFTTEQRLHRGYRDESGRFTMEQCRLAASNEADDLTEYLDPVLAVHLQGLLPENIHFSEPPADMEHCEHCFVR